MTITVFIAVLPWDYTDATADVFETEQEARDFIDQHAGAQKHYGQVAVRTLRVKPKKKGVRK